MAAVPSRRSGRPGPGLSLRGRSALAPEAGSPVGVRHPAGLDRLDHGTGVEGDPPELDADSRAVDGQHRILRARVRAEALLRLVVVVRKADAARVHVVAVTETARSEEHTSELQSRVDL